MSTSPAKTLSPAELAKLEHAFATDPASDAYRPLAEAYLGMGRFMEAMVVCKKGVKAHPNRPDPRLLLARVYAEQGKDKKALEELASALTVAPTDKTVLRMTGLLQLKGGEVDLGTQNLLQAHASDPTDADTLAGMLQYKVEPPRKAAPPPVLVEAPTERVATLQQNGAAGPELPRRTGQRAMMNGATSSSTGPIPRATGQRAPPRPHEETYFEESVSHAAPVPKSKGQTAFFIVGPVLAVVLIGLLAWGQYNGKKQREFKKDLSEAQRALDDDSFASYQRACAEADAALDVDASSALGQGYAAYAWAVRWGEHGGGDDALRRAQEHIALGKKIGDPDSHLYAADALVKLYSGKVTQALTDLEAQVKTLDEQHRQSALLFSTLGLIQMNTGDLEHALESLTKAQQLSPSDPRIYSIKGNVYRRRGEEKEAKEAFATALKYKTNHPDSQLGRAIIWSEGEDPRGYIPAAHVLSIFIDSEPPPSPRQLAVAHMTRTLLVARVVAAARTLRPDQARALAEGTRLPSDSMQARQEIQKEDSAATNLDGTNPELHLLRGHRMIIEGNLDGASKEVRDAIQLDPSRALYFVELARILLQKPDGAKEAQDALNQAIRTVGESPRLMFMLGQTYRKQNKPDEALAQFRKAVEVPRSKNPDARIAMTEIFIDKKDFANAEVQIQKAVDELLGSPGSKLAEAYVMSGRVQEGKGDRAKAQAAYEKALGAGADYAPGYFFYARLLNGGDANAKAKAKVTAVEYLKLDPSGPFATDALALAR